VNRVCEALAAIWGEPPTDVKGDQMPWNEWIEAHLCNHLDTTHHSGNQKIAREAARKAATIERKSLSSVENPRQITERIQASKDAKVRAEAEAEKAKREEERRRQHEAAEEAHRIAEEARLARVEEARLAAEAEG
jgi:hypothetical protein